MLAEIGGLRRIVVPVNVSLSPASSRGARPEERLLRANFEVQTYVVRTVDPVTPP
jgi:hypothetical protein